MLAVVVMATMKRTAATLMVQAMKVMWEVPTRVMVTKTAAALMVEEVVVMKVMKMVATHMMVTTMAAVGATVDGGVRRHRSDCARAAAATAASCRSVFLFLSPPSDHHCHCHPCSNVSDTAIER